jgi:hypothetical protein
VRRGIGEHGQYFGRRIAANAVTRDAFFGTYLPRQLARRLGIAHKRSASRCGPDCYDYDAAVLGDGTGVRR